jgi:hypothetical protein
MLGRSWQRLEGLPGGRQGFLLLAGAGSCVWLDVCAGGVQLANGLGRWHTILWGGEVCGVVVPCIGGLPLAVCRFDKGKFCIDGHVCRPAARQ